MPDDKIEIFVEDREEFPSTVSRKIKVLEIPMFTAEDRKRVQAALDKIDALVEEIRENRLMINEVFSEQAGRLREISDTLRREKIDELVAELRAGRVSALNMNMELAAKIGALADVSGHEKEIEILVDMKDALNLLANSLENIEGRMVSLLGKTVENIENFDRKFDSLSALVSDFDKRTDEKFFILDSQINYLKGGLIDTADKVAFNSEETKRKIDSLVETVSEKLDASASQISGRLDNVAVQSIEPINDISLRLDAMARDIDSKFSGVSREINAIKRAKVSVKVHLPVTAFEMLDEARKKIRSKRVPKKNQTEKKVIINVINTAEINVLDLFIFSALGNKALTFSAIKKDIPLGETRIRKRLNELVKESKIVKSKKNKLTVYALV